MAKEISTKTYTIGGTSLFKGTRTFRVANGKLNIRRNMLKFKGHTQIKLVELPKPMDKVRAVAWLKEQGYKASVPTRAKNKAKKSSVLIQAEALVAKRAAAAEKRAAAKAALAA